MQFCTNIANFDCTFIYFYISLLYDRFTEAKAQEYIKKLKYFVPRRYRPVTT